MELKKLLLIIAAAILFASCGPTIYTGIVEAKEFKPSSMRTVATSNGKTLSTRTVTDKEARIITLNGEKIPVPKDVYSAVKIGDSITIESEKLTIHK